MGRMSAATMPRKASSLQLAIILIPLLFALILIYLGFADYLSTGGDPTKGSNGSLFMSMGMALLAFSTYWLFQTRKRMLKLVSIEMQPLSTTLQCQKCGLKNIRDFQRGDFVFKQTDQTCPKDNEKMIISAIYRESKEKEKTKEEANP